MKNRKWVLVLAGFLTLLIVGAYSAWKMTRASDKIRLMLLKEIRPYLSQESDISNLDFGLNSIHLRGVKIVPKDEAFMLEIEDLRLSIRLWNVLIYGLSPVKLTHQVMFDHPSIVIFKEAPHIKPETFPAAEGAFQDWIGHLRKIRRISVVNAEVVLADSLDSRIVLAHSLDGWIQTVPADSAPVRLEGRLLNAEKDNVTIDGRVNLLSGSPLAFHLNMEESTPSNELPMLLPDYMEVLDGTMKGELFYDRQNQASGYVQIRDGAFRFKNARLQFQGLTLDGSFHGRGLNVTGGVADFNGSPLNIRGQIHNLLKPFFDVRVEGQMDMGRYFDYAAPGLPVSGRSQLALGLSGSLNNPRIEGELASDSLSFFMVDFASFHADVGLRDSVFTLGGGGFEEDGFLLDVVGEVDLTDSLRLSSLDVDFEGNFLTHFPFWLRQIIQSSQGKWHLGLEGPLNDLTGQAQGVFSLQNREGLSLTLRQEVAYAQKRLNMVISSNGTLRIEGSMDRPFQENATWQMDTEGLEVLLFPFLKDDVAGWIRRHSVSGRMQGVGSDWDVTARFFRQQAESYPKAGELSLSSKRQKRGHRLNLQGIYIGLEGGRLEYEAQGWMTDDSFELESGNIGDLIQADGVYVFNDHERSRGKIRLGDFYFEKLHSVFPGSREFFGELSGGVEWAGDDFQSHLEIKRGRFHNIGEYSGFFDTDWRQRLFYSGAIHLKRNSRNVFQGEARRVAADSLTGFFSGDSLDLDALFTSFLGTSPVSGRADVRLNVKGGLRMPLVSSQVDLSDVRLFGIGFPSGRIEAVDTLWTETGFRDGALGVMRLSLLRQDDLEFNAWGVIPHTGKRDADVSMRLNGNVLGFLPEISPTFVQAEGQGEVFGRWAGRGLDWVLTNARARINSGTLRLADIVKKIDEINCDIELAPGERFVRLHRLSGKAAGGQFEMTNRWVDEDNSRFQPFVSQALRLNFGVLEFSTPGKGLMLHIPGLMEPREEGWLAFGGKGGEGPFIFGGPAENPLFHGRLTLSDNRLTYPFLELSDKKSGPSPLVQFFERVTWDLEVFPLKDVHYVNRLTNPLGNVNIDLKLRDRYGMIELAGVIEEQTFQIWGNLLSTEGNIDVLDHYFRPEQITFDYPRGAQSPIIAGRASTTVIDSLGMHSTVWLSLAAVDVETGLETKEGPWSRVQFRFSSDNPNLGRTEADLLAALGYSAENFRDRAYDALGMRVENLLFRPIFRPLERGLRRHLGLDVVRVSSMFSRNLVQMQTQTDIVFDPKMLLRSTKLTLGKYLAPGLFLIYSGQVQNNYWIRYPTQGIGLRHALMLEYAIRPDLLLQMEYTYDSQLLSDRREDKRIWLKHVFPF